LVVEIIATATKYAQNYNYYPPAVATVVAEHICILLKVFLTYIM